MKKIIDKKVYDTKTATMIGWQDNGFDQQNFNYFEETLYRKKTGEYFLYGEGGPLTKYADFYNGCNTEGREIVPLTFEDARNWAEKNLNHNIYMEEFGVLDEEEADDSRAMLTITLPKAKIAVLQRLADNAEMSVSHFIDQILII